MWETVGEDVAVAVKILYAGGVPKQLPILFGIGPSIGFGLAKAAAPKTDGW